ncbi:MAG: EAL domain-containing protein [Pseudomonadota bacterium]
MDIATTGSISDRTRRDRPQARALVIDDDPFIRLLARDHLEKLGLHVREAPDGAAGLAAIAELAPDLILLDVMMPDMDGFEVCRRARQLPEGALCPIVVLTALEDVDAVNQAYEAGATDFISKPINWVLLQHRLRFLLKAASLLQSVAKSDAQMAHAQQLSAVGSWEWRLDTGRVVWSEEMYHLCGGRAAVPVPGYQAFLPLVHPDDRQRVALAVRAALADREPYDLEHRLLSPDGCERIVHSKADILFGASGLAVAMSGTMQDITQRRQAEQRIAYLANFDALTGLPNRHLLNDRLTQGLALAARNGQALSLMCLDLDGFKYVNDSYGHAMGDRLLQAVARRLQAVVRASDTVARLGGDEFVLVLPGLAGVRDVRGMAQKLVDAFAEPFLLGQHVLRVSASVGIGVAPADGGDSEALLKNADVAMYAAKEAGRNGYRFYAQEMSQRVEQRVELEHALREAVERHQFELYYQPKVDLRGGRIMGVEALVRWHRPGYGMVSPDSFIPLAEETRLIVPIGEWVLRTACAQASAWHAMGFEHLSMAVNLSAHQFAGQHVARLLLKVLADAGLAANQLELELTESVLMSDSDAMLAALRDIKALGVLLTLDDFGTGYSSLAYLRRFPIDVLKIDRSFVRNVTTDADDASLARTIVLMAQSLKMKTVAEGVETAGQLQFLAGLGCDAVQGYYFSAPLAAPQLTALLHAPGALPAVPGELRRERTLLLLDDEPNVLSALTRLLRRDGYHILQTTCAHAAFELLATHDVQVIVSDQRMPTMAGTAFLQQVKQLYPDTIRIILSGYTELSAVIDAINQGAVYRFLTKPWDDQLLRAQVREAFDMHRLMHGGGRGAVPVAGPG